MSKKFYAVVRRRDVLVIGTALVVAFTHNFVLSGRYTFESVWYLLGFWLVHYGVVVVMTVVFFATLTGAEKFFLDRTVEVDSNLLGRAMVYFCIAVLICSLVIMLVAHLPAGYADWP